VFGGVALAVDKKDGNDKKDVEVTKTGGVGGAAGNPAYNCALVGVVQTSTGDAAGYNPSILLTCTTADVGYGSALAVY
jgi:hypothetical protein